MFPWIPRITRKNVRGKIMQNLIIFPLFLSQFQIVEKQTNLKSCTNQILNFFKIKFIVQKHILNYHKLTFYSQTKTYYIIYLNLLIL